MVRAGVSASLFQTEFPAHLRIFRFHSNGRGRPSAPALFSPLAGLRRMRHGPCLLVHQDDVSPLGGTVNEEMSA